MEIVYKNKTYNISDEVWKKHSIIHPKRSMDALIHGINVALSPEDVSSENIERIIENEFFVIANIDKIIEKAREKYNEEYPNGK